MLVEYCAQLGLHPFDDGFYAGRGLLIESPVDVPGGGKEMSLRDTQRYWGIRPGM
jgi:hypothetical protein